MESLIQAVAAKKAELDRLRPRAPGGLTNLEHSHDLELTYTSNAIEGNTLTAIETTLVVEQGITRRQAAARSSRSHRPLRCHSLCPFDRAPVRTAD
jgi:Fic family protein